MAKREAAICRPPDTNRQGYSINEFCERWGISRVTVYTQISEGLLQSMKVGRRRIITRDHEAAWRERLCKRTSTGKY